MGPVGDAGGVCAADYREFFLCSSSPAQALAQLADRSQVSIVVFDPIARPAPRGLLMTAVAPGADGAALERGLEVFAR